MHDIESFRGQTSPELVYRTLDKSDVDKPLFGALSEKWRKVYIDPGSGDHADIALFRSLNMAYRAGSIPGGADATEYDYGRATALWVSAFEILVHPGGSNKVGLLQVYDLLARAPYVSESVSEAIYEAYESSAKQAPKRSIACWLYGEIYRARNDFLHGNPLPDDRLVIASSGRLLLDFAPPLYRLALSAALRIRWAVPQPSEADAIGEWISDEMDFYLPQRTIEKALLACSSSRKA